jgi:aspartate kinase
MASQGERLSANLLTIVLEEFGIPASYVDARRCILTNEEHGQAEPLFLETEFRLQAELKPLLEAKRVPVLAGFIGATRDSATTTLGRGSSNYSATLVSAALGARETQIWTDVDGLKTADPCLVKTARTVSQLSYEEAAELARLGAGVLHPKMFEPVRKLEIPVHIRDSRSPKKPGTLICSRTETSGFPVKAIAHQTNLTTIEITSTPVFVANGFLHAIEEIFARRGAPMNLVAMSDVGISCTHESDASLSSIVEDLSQVGAVATEKHRAIISCVGAGLNSSSTLAENVRRMLSNIDPSLTWRSTSSSNLIAVVDTDGVGQSVRNLHQGIFESDWQVDDTETRAN